VREERQFERRGDIVCEKSNRVIERFERDLRREKEGKRNGLREKRRDCEARSRGREKVERV
jgi:hypothetical protein